MALEPVSFGDEAPSGENLEYESVFTDLEIAAQPGEERQMGDEIVAAEEPDYVDVIAKARAVLEQSHDLRAAIYLAQAELRRNGFPGFAEAVAYIKGCLGEFWDTCHPQLDAEDDNDPTMRVNAVRGLADPDLMLPALRQAPLTKSGAFGQVCLRHQMILDGDVYAHSDEHVPDAAAFSAAFQDTDPEVLAEIVGAVRQAEADIREIDGIFDEKIPGYGPDLGELKKVMARIVALVAEETGAEVEDAGEEYAGDQNGAGAASGAPAGAVQGAPGAIRNDGDVLKAIDRITEYFEKTQPSSPVPILLARARRLVGADFLTIVNDLAPLGLENVQAVGGITPPEEEY